VTTTQPQEALDLLAADNLTWVPERGRRRRELT
jgi:hypothetical protein